jgi:hypothetical protein
MAVLLIPMLGSTSTLLIPPVPGRKVSIGSNDGAGGGGNERLHWHWQALCMEWTSVRQERWQGDLVVEGNLPAWLFPVASTLAQTKK